MEWPGHLPLVGGGGVSVLYQSISIDNHACLSSKYIHMRSFKVLNS